MTSAPNAACVPNWPGPRAAVGSTAAAAACPPRASSSRGGRDQCGQWLSCYRLTHWNALRAFFRPGFLRSTMRESRVSRPACARGSSFGRADGLAGQHTTRRAPCVQHPALAAGSRSTEQRARAQAPAQSRSWRTRGLERGAQGGVPGLQRARDAVPRRLALPRLPAAAHAHHDVPAAQRARGCGGEAGWEEGAGQEEGAGRAGSSGQNHAT